MRIYDKLNRGQLANISSQLKKQGEELAYIMESEEGEPIVVSRAKDLWKRYTIERLPDNEVKLARNILTIERW
ncbi:hypothetical protein J6U76_04245 [bacterium]|nr:hypothetical protein [bacterium]